MGQYYVDGYAMVDNRRIILEFNGCAYHSCDKCKQVRIYKNDEEKRKQYFRSLANVTMIDISSCEWHAIKCELKDFEPSISPLLFERTVATSTLLNLVQQGKLYGFMVVDIDKTNMADKWRSLNWPPIMQKSKIFFTDLPSWMQEMYDRNEFPQETIVQKMHAKELLLHTSLLQFYLNNGFYVKKLHKFYEYQGANCFKKVFDTVYKARVEATQVTNDKTATTEDKAAAEMKATAVKLVSNSMYGSLLLVSLLFYAETFCQPDNQC